MRLVIDTNIAISGLLWNGAPARLLELLSAGDHLVFSSPILLAEFRGILARAKFDDRISVSTTTRGALAESFTASCILVSPVRLSQPIAPDPDDDWVIATAIAANADLIVTGDKPLLSVASVGSIRIVTATEALAMLEAG